MKIMAIPTACLTEYTPNVLHPFSIAASQLLSNNHDYRERDPLETDPSWRQIIPYVLVKSPKGYCLMQRCKGQGEARLLGKHYIGAGGHVEEGHSIYYTALKECTEELGLPLTTLELTGLMLTNGSPVDDVHLCVFGRAETLYTRFTSPEGLLHEARWVDTTELLQHTDTMEKWSQIIVEHVFKAERDQARLAV